MIEERLLECTDVSKSFGPTKAVVGVDFSLPRGEIRGLIGENGSGKSTLCNIITGILKPDTGHMLLEGKPFAPASLLDSKREGISILLQESLRSKLCRNRRVRGLTRRAYKGTLL